MDINILAGGALGASGGARAGFSEGLRLGSQMVELSVRQSQRSGPFQVKRMMCEG